MDHAGFTPPPILKSRPDGRGPPGLLTFFKVPTALGGYSGDRDERG